MAHLISDGAADLLAALRCHALRHTCGADTARLRADDADAAALTPLNRVVQDELRHL